MSRSSPASTITPSTRAARMCWINLLLLFLAVLALGSHVTAEKVGTLSNHRRESRSQEKLSKRKKYRSVRRHLQDEFSTSFVITWFIAIGNGESDRQPTDDEYEVVVEATANWFMTSTETSYGAREDLDVQDVDCTLDPSGTSWDPSNTEYPHTVRLNCRVNWTADEGIPVPTPIDYLLLISQNSQVMDFMTEHLILDPGLFRFSQAVRYETSTTNSPGGTGGAPRPTFAPVAPSPTPSFSSSWALPFSLTFNLSILPSTTDRQPTTAEYEGFQAAVEKWLLESFRAAYAGETSFAIRQFTSNMASTSWDPTIGSGLPHQMVMDVNAIYNANALENLPNLVDFFITFRSIAASYDYFVTTYIPALQPTTSVFRSTETSQYTSTQNGPIVPYNGAAPTRAPISPTVAPVMPDGQKEGVSTGVDRADFENAQSVTLSVLYRYRLDNAAGTPKVASPEEWEGLQEATRTFWMTTLENYYQDDTATDFVIIDGKWEIESMKSAVGETFSYSGRYVTDILFTEESTVPNLSDMRQTMSTLIRESDYIASYVRTAMPANSVFRDTVEVAFDF